MRIVGGSARGRVLQAPRDARIRPTADRVRETLFNILGQRLDGVRVLDLCAGTGAFGLEAVSRGAEGAVLVDSAPAAVGLCKDNAEALGFTDRVEVLREDALRAIERLSRDGTLRFGVVFVDPPYAKRLGGPILERLLGSGLVDAGGWILIEHDRAEVLPEAIEQWDARRFGQTVVSLFRIP